MSEYRPADLAFWDSVNIFSIHEVAWLWCELDPPEHKDIPTSDPHLRHQALLSSPKLPSKGARVQKAILRDRQLKPTEDEEGWPGDYHRADLRAWAERQGYAPLFLFPELRPEKPAGLSLEGALHVIAALARAVDSRWNPGQNAPHGMAKRLVEVAGNLNLRLDRNTIGKYLKAAGNKNISA